MVRTQSLAMSRPAGFALLKPASKPQLDAARIATMSGTIAVNLLAFGLLMMPLTMPPPVGLVDVDKDPDIRWIEPKRPEPIPVEIVNRRQPTPPDARPQQPRVATTATTPVASTPVITDTATEQAIESTVVDSGPTDIGPVSTGPAPMQLEYLSAPAPTYPRNALRAGITGTVLLQVLVGTDGRAVEVKVAQSSGNRELDEAARAQVLKRWSFRPATRDGQAIQALGMVPIEFHLR